MEPSASRPTGTAWRYDARRPTRSEPGEPLEPVPPRRAERPRGPPAGAIAAEYGIARRQIRRIPQGSQPPPEGQDDRRGGAAEHRRDRGRPLRRARLLVARLDEARRPADHEGGRAEGLPDRVVAPGPGPAEARIRTTTSSPATGSRSRGRTCSTSPPRKEIAVADDLFAQPLEPRRVRLVGRLVAVHLPLQPAGAPGPAARRDRRGDRRGAGRSSTSGATTFIDYSQKMFRHDVAETGEILWASERDGWNHLYLYDGRTGAVKNPITQGEWVVRGVDRVDEARRQVWFRAGGIRPGQDPYHVHHARVNFDGTGLVVLTEGDGTHEVVLVARPPVPGRHLLARRPAAGDRAPPRRRTARWSACWRRPTSRPCAATGWKPPERFVGQGARRRDRHLRRDLSSQELRSGQEIPGHRADLRRPARGLRAQAVRAASPGSRPWPSSASSSCRSTAWGRTGGRRRSTTSAGRTWATPASPTASSG